MSNPAQNRATGSVIVMPSPIRLFARAVQYSCCHGMSPANGRKSEGGLMEPVLRRFRNRVRKLLASVADKLSERVAAGKPRSQDFGSQRMCPFCGLITPRAKRLCLECGKSLRGIQVERKDATQE